MRLVCVKSPAGQGKDVLEIAFSVGICQAVLQQIHIHQAGGTFGVCNKVELETSTPLAKKFVEQLLNAPFYERSSHTVSIRDIRSLITGRDTASETLPIVAPATDVFQELWQFSHITASHAGRAFIAALLLAYGMINLHIPVMIAGLLFLPYHHQMLSIGFGLRTRDWALFRQGVLNVMLTSFLVVLAGFAAAVFMEPPIQFNGFGNLTTSFLFALLIGIAASLSSADDAGRRELVGLAAAGQLSLIPAWIGISLVFGFTDMAIVLERLGSFLVSIVTLVLSASATYALLRFRSREVPLPVK